MMKYIVILGIIALVITFICFIVVVLDITLYGKAPPITLGRAEHRARIGSAPCLDVGGHEPGALGKWHRWEWLNIWLAHPRIQRRVCEYDPAMRLPIFAILSDIPSLYA
jgi:hypothetical protein